MKVFCITGPCGAGKSSVMQEVPARINRKVIIKHKEGYKEQDEDKEFVRRFYIDNLLHVSKLKYQAEWFNSCLKYQNEDKTVVLSDRSPIDTVSYVANREKYLEIVDKYFEEMTAKFGIKFYFIYFQVSPEVMLRRIADRLLRETWRKNYNEDDQDVMLRTRTFFEERLDRWDLVLDADGKVDKIADEVSNFIRENTR